MFARGAVQRLLLGPIVGHTDHASTRIWIRAGDDPAAYTLRVKGRGTFPFASTEVLGREFGTAVAVATDLRSEWRYRYEVLRRDRTVPGSAGSFRTMPPPQATADVLFVSLSCHDFGSDTKTWEALAAFIKAAQPRFLLMAGDQIYETAGDNVFTTHFRSDPARRRRAFADQYQATWSKEPVREILANTPVYMMGDDHEFRDGWGSFAPDSPTLAALYPKGREIAAQYNAFFHDARDVYWHFQRSHGPPTVVARPPPPSVRQAMPIAFRCGRLEVLMLDNRCERDFWRARNPVFGDSQWRFIQQRLDALPPDIDALAVVTPVPIVTDSSEGIVQRIFGDQTFDVDAFRDGDEKRLLQLQGYTGELGRPFSPLEGAAQVIFPLAPDWPQSGLSKLIGVGYVFDARDRWSHRVCRPERERLLRVVGRATLTNRAPALPRSVVFIGGDIHAGALLQITAADPAYSAQCLIASPIGVDAGRGMKVEDDFEAADGVRVKLLQVVPKRNFGVTHVLFGAGPATINNSIPTAGGDTCNA